MHEKRLRVCFCLWQGHNLISGGTSGFGGAEKVVWGIAKELAKDPNLDVRLATLTDNPGGESVNNVTIVPVPPGKPIPAHASPLRRYSMILLHAWRVARILARQRARIYFACLPGIETSAAWLASRMARGKYIYRVASQWETNPADLKQFVVNGSGSVARIHIATLRRADIVTAQSNSQVGELQRNYGVRAHRVIRNAHQIPAEVPGAESRRQILWVARVHPRKHPLEFLQLAREMPDTAFHMVMSPSDAESVLFNNVQQEARAIANLRFTGGMSADEMPGEYTRSRAVVMTSSSEGFSNVVIEALKTGTPVVMLHLNPDGLFASVSGEPLAPAPGFCAEGERQRMQSVLQRLTTDDDFWRNCSREAYELARREFDITSIVKTYKDLFSEAADRE